MCSVYPATFPASLCEFPQLLKGKVAQAAEIFLSARCDYDGALACEMAAHLLDEEMISGDTPYSFEERWAILANAHELDDYVYGKGLLADPLVREKVEFVISLATSFAHKDRDNFIRFMNEAAHCARYLARIYRERLEAETNQSHHCNLILCHIVYIYLQLLNLSSFWRPAKSGKTGLHPACLLVYLRVAAILPYQDYYLILQDILVQQGTFMSNTRKENINAD